MKENTRIKSPKSYFIHPVLLRFDDSRMSKKLLSKCRCSSDTVSFTLLTQFTLTYSNPCSPRFSSIFDSSPF